MPLSVPWDPSNQVRPPALRGVSSGPPFPVVRAGLKVGLKGTDANASRFIQLAKGFPDVPVWREGAEALRGGAACPGSLGESGQPWASFPKAQHPPPFTIPVPSPPQQGLGTEPVGGEKARFLCVSCPGVPELQQHLLPEDACSQGQLDAVLGDQPGS